MKHPGCAFKVCAQVCLGQVLTGCSAAAVTVVLTTVPLVYDLQVTRQRCGPHQGTSMKSALVAAVTSQKSVPLQLPCSACYDQTCCHLAEADKLALLLDAVYLCPCLVTCPDASVHAVIRHAFSALKCVSL